LLLLSSLSPLVVFLRSVWKLEAEAAPLLYKQKQGGGSGVDSNDSEESFDIFTYYCSMTSVVVIY
jgi:hypothetical protein